MGTTDCKFSYKIYLQLVDVYHSVYFPLNHHWHPQEKYKKTIQRKTSVVIKIKDKYAYIVLKAFTS